MMRKITGPRATGLTALAMLLAACGGGDDPAEQDGGEDTGPQGEVRGGTISDAMLPVAMLQSQSPQRGGGDSDGEDSEDGEEADDAE